MTYRGSEKGVHSSLGEVKSVVHRRDSFKVFESVADGVDLLVKSDVGRSAGGGF